MSAAPRPPAARAAPVPPPAPQAPAQEHGTGTALVVASTAVTSTTAPYSPPAASPSTIKPPSLREMNRQHGYHRAGDPDHIPERCPDCVPALLAAARERAGAPVRRPVVTAVSDARLSAFHNQDRLRDAPVQLPALQAPAVRVLSQRPDPQSPDNTALPGTITTGIQVLNTTLTTDQARAMWAQLAEALGASEQNSCGWIRLRAWLDQSFSGSVPVRYRDTGTKEIHMGAAIPDGRTHILLRTGIYAVARLRRRGSGNFAGAVLAYSPGPLSMSAHTPDAKSAVTQQRVAVLAVDAGRIFG